MSSTVGKPLNVEKSGLISRTAVVVELILLFYKHFGRTEILAQIDQTARFRVAARNLASRTMPGSTGWP
jgi:hypothetical protein